MKEGTRLWLDRGRRAALVLVLLGALAVFADVVHEHYPIQRWLFWHYAVYWLCAAVWSVACFSLGHLTLKLVLGRPLPALEQYAIAFALGVLEFEILLFLAGTVKLYGPVLFFGLPLAMIAAGGLPLWRFTRRHQRHLRALRQRAPPGLPSYIVMAFGLLGLGMLYFLILTPENTAYDARWMHLVVAEDYVASGGVRRFPEGYLFAAAPHFGSFIYAWAFVLPGGVLFDRIVLAAHLEFAVFLWVTLLGIPAMVRRLVPRANPRLVWAARFLFPGVFLYDSSLTGGADHLGAMYCAPVLLLLLRAWRNLSPRYCFLLASMLAGSVITKYTVAFMLAPVPIVVVGVRMLMLAWQSLRGRVEPTLRRHWYLGPLAAIVAGVAVSSPHWLRNLVWYGDPLYPLLHKHFGARPWAGDASYVYQWMYSDFQLWAPSRDWKGFVETLKALFTFSFIPNDWPAFHGKVPVFGSLFTLLIASLPFLRRTRRLWLLVGWVHISIFIWYWTHHQDRYLQAIMPFMAAVTAGAMVLIWHQARWVVRGALGALVGLQVVWGGDVYFLPTHF